MCFCIKINILFDIERIFALYDDRRQREYSRERSRREAPRREAARSRDAYRADNYRRESQRRESQRREPTSRYERRREYERRRKQQMRRLRNRVIIVTALILVVVLVIVLLTTAFKGCGGSSKDKEALSVAATSKVEATTAKDDEDEDIDEFPTEYTDEDFIAPKIDDDNSNGTMSNSLYIWNNSAFELFYGDKDIAKNYANLINTAQKKLGSDINLYSMIVPNHTEMGLPERLKNTSGGADTASQAEYIKNAYTAMNSKVHPVNVYNALSEHCNEYIYFHSDHHWTGLGAYYAYAAFMEQIDQTPLNLSDCEEKEISGFEGSFLNLVSSGVDSDTVHYWEFPYNAPMTVTDSDGEKTNYDSPYCSYADSGSFTYSVFLYGDNPFTVIKSSSENTSDEKIFVVHESYGNAMIPYLTNNFKEVYAVDFRDWNGNIKEFCEKNDITNVLFLNGVMSSGTADQVEMMKSLL